MMFSIRAKQELTMRAQHQLPLRFLAVDYYRIRNKVAVSLPVSGLADASVPVRGFTAVYPWSIWLLWSLEDRLLTLGEHVEASGDAQAQVVVESELFALTQWRTFRGGARIDLPCSHAMRILWTALTQWHWVNASLRELLEKTVRRIVDDVQRFSDKDFAQFDSVQQLLLDESVSRRLHNIPVIGTCMLALAARAVTHPAADRLDRRVNMLVMAILGLRTSGLTEGVSYDGYVLDFVADWLLVQPPSVRDPIVEHGSFGVWCRQAIDLGVPGDVMGTAPLGDVEPLEMSFVWSALSKLQRLCPGVTDVLAQLDVSRLRSDALRVWRNMADSVRKSGDAGNTWARNPHAVVMRTGSPEDQFAAVVGASVSPMGHIQADSGSIVLGMRKRWWIDDPGYQQYAQTTERDFTIGPTAHNTPVINGQGQVFKRAVILSEPGVKVDESGTMELTLDLTACYEPQSGVKKLERTVWMLPTGSHVVICDVIDTVAPALVAWHWHGHADLYWALNKTGVSLVDSDMGDVLHIMSPQLRTTATSIQRLPGSRGQKTLVSSVFATERVAVWWVFSRTEALPVCELQKNVFVVDGHPILLGDRLDGVAETLSLLPTEVPPLQVTAVRKGRIVTAVCHVNKKRFPGDVEFAFYLMSGESKIQVLWYSPSAQVELQVPDDIDLHTLKVHGFVRNKADHTRKLMKAVQVLG
ncbi:heparinase II/III-family protein [Alcaligenes aquatilis]|uniref:heparinase II/III domain-containing protein n=1 Tax=Alcaligenes aquatilis TaxID=323284 RepID=UPI000F661419|nr:heparinase II/III family protein [Alcaligenes aquatilis]QXR35672.1 heparinase II/III-family protein [Alcaligenes aquatilis]